MEDCCGWQPNVSRACPGCGRLGREVDRITLKALLRPEALIRLGSDEHRFCPTPECRIVYFREDHVFQREDVLVPVFQKEGEGGRLVCYCFGISEDQIRQEIETSGFSASAQRIRVLVRSSRCACEVRNPQGTCCLGNVAAVSAQVAASAHRAQASTA